MNQPTDRRHTPMTRSILDAVMTDVLGPMTEDPRTAAVDAVALLVIVRATALATLAQTPRFPYADCVARCTDTGSGGMHWLPCPTAEAISEQMDAPEPEPWR